MASCRLASARVSWIFRSNSTDMVLAARQDFGQVHGTNVRARARKGALNLHQATRVERYYGISARAHDGVDPGARHGPRKPGELDGERAAESAALFGRHHLAQRQSLHASQQAARRRPDAQLAQPVAAIVKCHHVVQARAHGIASYNTY